MPCSRYLLLDASRSGPTPRLAGHGDLSRLRGKVGAGPTPGLPPRRRPHPRPAVLADPAPDPGHRDRTDLADHPHQARPAAPGHLHRPGGTFRQTTEPTKPHATCSPPRPSRQPRRSSRSPPWIPEPPMSPSRNDIRNDINDAGLDEANTTTIPVSYTHLTLPTKR